MGSGLLFQWISSIVIFLFPTFLPHSTISRGQTQTFRIKDNLMVKFNSLFNAWISSKYFTPSTHLPLCLKDEEVLSLLRLPLSQFELYLLVNNVYFDLKLFSDSFFPFILALGFMVMQVSPSFFSAGSNTYFSFLLCSPPPPSSEGLLPIFSLTFWLFNSQSLKYYNAHFPQLGQLPNKLWDYVFIFYQGICQFYYGSYFVLTN